MRSSPGRYLGLLLLCAGMTLPLRSEETPAPKQPTSPRPAAADKKTDKKIVPGPMPSADSKKPIDLKDLDLSTLPTDAVLILCERAAEALQMVPNAVILTPSKYQEMRDEIERLRKLLQVERPIAPSRVHLTGRVGENTITLQAEFQGSTERPNTLVLLACPQAGAASAQLDGQVADIRPSDSGFVVRIEKPGPYHLKIDLFVPLATRDGSRGFVLTLPQAAITQLDLDLPPNSKDVRVGGRPLSDPELAGLTFKPPHLSGSPSSSRAVDRLDLSWKEMRPPSGVPVLTAEGGKIQVRLDPSGLTTEAELVLRVEGAPANVWRLLVPPNAEVAVEETRLKAPITTEKKTAYAWLQTIHLKEASTDPLKIAIKVHAPVPSGGKVVPIGPFFVLGAARQTGTIVVRNQVRNLHLYYPERAGVKPQPRPDDPGGDVSADVAAFSYSNIPVVEKPQAATGPNSLSWLDLDVETVRSQVRTRVIHNLTLRPSALAPEAGGDKERTLHWEILTSVALVSKWSEIDQLKVFVPPEWTPGSDTIPVTSEKNGKVVTYRPRILRDKSMQQLPGRYELPCQAEGRAILKLPQPQGAIEQCDITLKVPAGSEVMLVNAEQAGLELVSQPRPNEQMWRCRNLMPNAPGLEVSWRPYRPEVPANSVADVTLEGQHASIRHEIRLHLPPNPPASLSLRVPASISDSLTFLDSGKLQRTQDAARPGGVRLAIPASAGGTECRLVLQYSASLVAGKGAASEEAGPFTVPLVVPEQTQGGIKVRVWSGLRSLPQSASGPPWEEGSIEEVKDHRELPVLVLRAPRSDAPLLLRSHEEDTVYTVLIERALVRVQLLDDGRQQYGARFQLRQLADKHLEIKLPAGALKVEITLNRKKVQPEIVNELGQRTEGGDVARLRLAPDLVRQTALLEVSYLLRPGGSGTPLHSILQPPILRGAPPAVPTRWLVSVPSNRVLIAPESGGGLERTWARRGWLLAARLNRSAADLQHEFEETLPSQSEPGESNGATPAPAGEQSPALVCWQDSIEPLTLTHAPQQAWLLVCSLSVLIVGLALSWTARPRSGEGGRMAAWLWPVLALMMLAVVIGVLFWPMAFWAVVYGCEPGLLVLLCVMAVQWLMHQRYRRQIVFLPSFSRGRAGSSLLRKSSAHRQPNGEPSTVDAPPPA